MSKVIRISERGKKKRPVFFSRFELNKLLSVYSQRVIRGEWKDYAIDVGSGSAAFSVFGATSAQPAYTIVKLAGSQKGDGKGEGQYVVYDGPRRIKRGSSITDVLAMFERELKLVSS